VLDTASGVLLKESGELLLEAVAELFDTVKEMAVEYRDTVMIGRARELGIRGRA